MDILSRLSPQIVPLTVVLLNGNKATFDMGSMTMHKWDELGEAVEDPLAPYVDTRNGQEIRNYADPKFLMQRRRAESQRAYRRLTYGFLVAGHVIEGITFEDQVQKVATTIDVNLAAAIMRWQADNVREGRARILSLADNFPEGNAFEITGDDAPEDIEVRVEDPERPGEG